MGFNSAFKGLVHCLFTLILESPKILRLVTFKISKSVHIRFKEICNINRKDRTSNLIYSILPTAKKSNSQKQVWLYGNEVTGDWRRLHNEELNDLYCSPNNVPVIKSWRLRWAGHVECMGEGSGVYRFLVGKPEGKRPMGRPKRSWDDNIRLDLQEVGCGYMDWTGLAQDRDRWRTLVSAVMNLRVP